jgi:hypothetical protein
VFKCCSLGDRIEAPVKGKANSQTERKWVSLDLGLGRQVVKEKQETGKITELREKCLKNEGGGQGAQKS